MVIPLLANQDLTPMLDAPEILHTFHDRQAHTYACNHEALDG